MTVIIIIITTIVIIMIFINIVFCFIYDVSMEWSCSPTLGWTSRPNRLVIQIQVYEPAFHRKKGSKKLYLPILTLARLVFNSRGSSFSSEVLEELRWTWGFKKRKVKSLSILI